MIIGRPQTSGRLECTELGRVMRILSSGSMSAEKQVVLIADAHALVRNGIKLIARELLYEALFIEVEDGGALAGALDANRLLSLVIVDIDMPGIEIEKLRKSMRAHSPVPIIIVSSLAMAPSTQRTLDLADVCAIVPRNVSAGALRSAMECALRSRQKRPQSSALTPRQAEVCRLLREGLSNKAIAAALKISEGTVKNHITEIFKTLNATNRTQAAERSRKTA